mgnify:CR=1 FL=1
MKQMFTRNEMGKMKMPEYGTEADASDWSEFNTVGSMKGPPEMRSESAQRALKSAM